MDKSPDAFRTISEVADWLGTPTHVLRFWESRFSQVKPVKRAGGRRYYRPKDMELLGGIKKLLHGDGLTIRGVQKLLRKEGVRHVAALSPPTDSSNIIQATATEAAIQLNAAPAQAPNVVHLQPAPAPELGPKVADPEPKPEPVATPELRPAPTPLSVNVPDDPADSDAKPVKIAGIAAALRQAASANTPNPPASPDFARLNTRLLALKKSMDQTADPDPAA